MKMSTLALLTAAISTAASIHTARAADDPVKAAATANSAFAVDLFQQLNKEATATNAGLKNSFFSPYSISVALGMADVGAKGNTADQMNKVLRFDNAATTIPGLQGLQKQLNADPAAKRPYELSIANALWVEQTFPLVPAYIDTTKQIFDTGGVTPQNFLTDAEGSRKHINDWVAAETHDKIKDLLPQGSVDKTTGMVITNAIYFLGTWQTQFDKARTSDQPFTLLSGQSAQVPMMHGSNQTMYNYTETNDFQAISLPYKAGDNKAPELSMVILLPKKADGLAAVEKQVSTDNLAKWSAAMKRSTVQVAMPKFKMTAEFELSKSLIAMGMTDAFSRKADFSGISASADGKLSISAVIHKAFVDVNEEGTEAAAATAVVMVRSMAMVGGQPITFTADHPFLFMIRHEPTNSILFMGHVMDPKN